MNLEICAYNIQSCITAQRAGAARIELCADPLQGGTTPSYGFIKQVLHKINLPIYPIIRPRGGSFFYQDDELEMMKTDILMCRELGCRGISTGVALKNGCIDIATMKCIVEWASPMGVSCHKVFDDTPDLYLALEALIETGCERVLTSGGCKTAIEGIEIIANLVAQAKGRIIIMPGGSVRANNVGELIQKTNAEEYHSSAIVNNNNFWADEEEITNLVNKLLSTSNNKILLNN